MLYEKLNERKRELGLTTEQLSQLSGIPVGTINKILSGETRSPRYDTLQALENVLYSPKNGDTADAVRKASAPCPTGRQGEYTVEDYRKLPGDMRAELIDGEMIFLEAPAFIHQELVTEILFEIGAYIRKNKGPCRILPSPLDVQLDCDDRTIVQPDITLICQNERITRKGIYGAPDFCIEIVSDSSRKRDYGNQSAEIYECRRPGILDRGCEAGQDRMLLVRGRRCSGDHDLFIFRPSTGQSF